MRFVYNKTVFVIHKLINGYLPIHKLINGYLPIHNNERYLK